MQQQIEAPNSSDIESIARQVVHSQDLVSQSTEAS